MGKVKIITAKQVPKPTRKPRAGAHFREAIETLVKTGRAVGVDGGGRTPTVVRSGLYTAAATQGVKVSTFLRDGMVWVTLKEG